MKNLMIFTFALVFIVFLTIFMPSMASKVEADDVKWTFDERLTKVEKKVDTLEAKIDSLDKLIRSMQMTTSKPTVVASTTPVVRMKKVMQQVCRNGVCSIEEVTVPETTATVSGVNCPCVEDTGSCPCTNQMTTSFGGGGFGNSSFSTESSSTFSTYGTQRTGPIRRFFGRIRGGGCK